MKKILFFRSIPFIFLLIGLSCTSSVKKSKEDTILRVGVMSSMDYLPLAIAQREGYFEKLGVQVKLQKFYSANDRDAAFQSCNIDGTVIDFTGAILQKAGGVDLVLTSKCDAPFYLVATNRSGINTISDLRGKQVAVSKNTVIDFIVDMSLKSVGLNEKDINKVEINKIPLRFEMLLNNKVDATGLPNPFALMAEAKDNRIITSNDSLGFAITGMMFHLKSVIDKNYQIKRMYEAYNMGVDYLNSHSPIDIKDILIKDFGFPESLIAQINLPGYTYAQLPKARDIEYTVDWLKEKKLIKVNFDPSILLDSQFLSQN